MNTINIELENTGDVSLPEVTDVRIANALATSDAYLFTTSDGKQYIGIKGHAIGTDQEGSTNISLVGEWDPGKVEGILQPLPQFKTSAEQFQSHPHVRDDPTAILPSITIDGRKIQWDFRPTHVETRLSAAQQVFTISGKTHDTKPQINAWCQIRIGYMSPIVHVEGGITFSDLDVEQWSLDNVNVDIQFGEPVHWDQHLSSDEPDRMYSSAMHSFKCRLLATDNDNPNAQRDWPPTHAVGKVWARATPETWDGHLLVYKKAAVGNKNWPFPNEWFKDNDGPRQINRPPSTGDRLAFGQLAGIETLYIDMSHWEALERATAIEALRQMHYFDKEGLPVNLDNHPDTIIYNSQPDFRLSKDRLGNPTDWFQSGNYRLHDEPHMAHTYNVLWYLLTGSEIARRVIYAQTELILHTRIDHWNQPRGVGRQLATLAYFWCVVDAATRLKIENFVAQRMRFLQDSWAALGIPEDAEVWPGMIDNHPAGYAKQMSDTTSAWSPFQIALMMKGVLSWRRIKPQIIPEEVLKKSVRAAKAVVDEAFYLDPMSKFTGNPNWIPYYAVAYQNGARVTSINGNDKPLEHNKLVRHSSSHQGIRLTVMNCILYYLEHGGDPVTLQKAQEIADQEPVVDWRSARWKGVIE